jgi:hypothetical protein
MALNLKTWERSRFEPGGGNAMVCFAIFGAFTEEHPISRADYRTMGLPDGVEMRRFLPDEHGYLPFAEHDFAKVASNGNSELVSRIHQAPECLVIQGEVADPPNLNYLRDCIGVVTFSLDHGGIAVADVFQIKYLEAAEWRADFFEPEQPKVGRHVVILYSEDENGPGLWFHTRGLRKFGRPDLSLRNVPESYRDGAIELCERFIQLQGAGGRIPEGQEIRMKSLPEGLVCHHGGSLEDPDFNNVHVEIAFPKE